MSNDYAIDYDEVVRESEAAILIRIDKDEHWMPKSQCRIYRKSNKIFVPEWLAIEKGLL